MEPGKGGTMTRTATRVRFPLERELTISEEFAIRFRANDLSQAEDLLTQLKSIWDRIDSSEIIERSGELTVEERELVGAAYWTLGEMRDHLNNLLYFTEHPVSGQTTTIGGGSRQREDASHSGAVR